MVVDLSTPTVASRTIVVPDTPGYGSFLNESDFMDESGKYSILIKDLERCGDRMLVLVKINCESQKLSNHINIPIKIDRKLES